MPIGPTTVGHLTGAVMVYYRKIKVAEYVKHPNFVFGKSNVAPSPLLQ
jgi:hypothetical protein